MKISRQKKQTPRLKHIAGHEPVDQLLCAINVTCHVSDMVVVMNTENGVRKLRLLYLLGVVQNT